MREIVPFVAPLGDLNLKETLLAGETVPSLQKFFQTPYCAHLSDLMENGESQGAVLFVPAISAKDLLNEFKENKKDDFYDEDDEDEEDEDFPHKKVPREIKRKVRR